MDDVRERVCEDMMVEAWNQKGEAKLTCAESMLGIVSVMYYGTQFSTQPTSQQDSKLAPSSSNDFQLSTLEMLTNPLRRPTPFEIWSPYEIALFEACMCKYGPVFAHYRKYIRTKTPQ